MAEKLDLEPKPVSVSLDHSTLNGTSVLPHPGPQSEKRDSVTFGAEPRNHSHDDYPDGGLRAWLVVLGVCVPVYTMNLWTVTEHALGCLCLFFNVSSFRHTACLRSLVQEAHNRSQRWLCEFLGS